MKTQKRHLIILLALTAALLGWGNTAKAQAQNKFRNANTGTEYATFADAYSNASSGDELVILVASITMTASGESNSNSDNVMVINKDITISVRDDVRLASDGYVTLDFSGGGNKQNGIDISSGKSFTIRGNSVNKIKVADMSRDRTYLFVIFSDSQLIAENVLIEGSKNGIFNLGGTADLTSCKIGDASSACILCNRQASTTYITNCMIYGSKTDTADFKEPLIREGSAVTPATLQTQLSSLHSGSAHAICVTKDPTWGGSDGSLVGSGTRTINIDGDNTKIFGFKNNAIYICYGNTVLNFEGGHIFNCYATDYGGSAVRITRYTAGQQSAEGYSINPSGNPTFNMSGGTIESCCTNKSGTGGAVSTAVTYVVFNMTGGTIKNNVSNYIGGGLYMVHGTVTINGGTISDNTASGNGGGIYQNQGTLTFTSGSISNNTAPNGGGIWLNSSGTLNLDGGSIAGNTANTNGGGVYQSAGTITIGGCSFGNNSATTAGGGVYIGSGTLTINSCSFSGNTAQHGGGINLNGGTMNLNGGSVVNNTATTEGGGIRMVAGTFYVGGAGTTPVVVKGNTVSSVPHDIYLASGKHISVKAANFDAQDVGIYTEATTTDVGVLYNSAGNYLSDLYNAIAYGTKNVFPNRTNYKVKAYSSSGDAKKYIYFTTTGVTSPWSATQQEVTESDLRLVNGVYEISNVKELTAFLWYVNDIDTHVNLDGGTSTHPSANGKLTANIDMDGQYWVPIANYIGTFDGNGHSISNLIMERSNASTQRGLFGTLAGGTVKNLQLNNCNFSSGQALYMGLVAAEQSSGNIYNCSVNGTLTGNSEPVTMGGFVGKITSGTLKNSFANTSCANGLVGNNGGAVENCYVRGTTGKVGSGTDAVNCYASTDGSDGDYTAVVSPYEYGTHDNLVGSTPLVKTLNNWVNLQSGTDYAQWGRPHTTVINGDYPVLKMDGSEAVAGDGTNLYYGTANGMIAGHKGETEAVYLYKSTASVASNVGETFKAPLYIDEDAAITQDGAVTATVGITLKNTQSSSADSWDWHMFSPAISDAPLGINYIVSEVNENTASGPRYGYGEEPPVYNLTGTGYFPTANAADYLKWDYYCYYEPQYHWINFKRNGPSHWHEDAPYGVHDHIDYVSDAGTNVNESTMKPGKGYLLATKDETLLQCKGTLNNTNVSIAVTTDGPYRKGYNFIGNPYQSYYDFEDFASDNAALWGGDVTKASYMLLSVNSYTSYTYGASDNKLAAPRCLHPHQGFMIVATNAGTATFDNDDRYIDGHSAFRDEQPHYPLVNLIATDGDGKSDLTTVELGRPDKGGAIKAYDLHLGKGCIYTHYEGEDYSIAFTQPDLSEVGIRFEADEEATFTMTWDMENGIFDYLHLIDNITGTDVDCLAATEYRFSATPDDYKSRFRLVFGYTGIEENEEEEEEDGPSTGSGTFAFQMGSQLVVNGEGYLEMIDMLGRIVRTEVLQGSQSTVSMPRGAVGVYVLRLTGRDGVRTQKIVIR